MVPKAGRHPECFKPDRPGTGRRPDRQLFRSRMEPAPGESFEAFRARAKAAAEAEGAPSFVFGGLPHVSQVPPDFDTQADAGRVRGTLLDQKY